MILYFPMKHLQCGNAIGKPGPEFIKIVSCPTQYSAEYTFQFAYKR